MKDKYIKKTLISMIFKMMCWKEEGKNWTRIYDELLIELSMNNNILDEDIRTAIVFKITPLKFMEEEYFKKKIFEVINYLNGIADV